MTIFRLDTLTGSAAGAHRTNVMFVQKDDMTVVRPAKKDIAETLKGVCEGLTAVQQNKIPAGASREPPTRES